VADGNIADVCQMIHANLRKTHGHCDTTRSHSTVNIPSDCPNHSSKFFGNTICVSLLQNACANLTTRGKMNQILNFVMVLSRLLVMVA